RAVCLALSLRWFQPLRRSCLKTDAFWRAIWPCVTCPCGTWIVLAAGIGPHQIVREVLRQRRWSGDTDSSNFEFFGRPIKAVCNNRTTRAMSVQRKHQHCRADVFTFATFTARVAGLFEQGS